jgi:hypothetical protein
LGLKDNRSNRRRFHFEYFWTILEGYQEIVQTTWESVRAVAYPFQTLEKKLKETAKWL